MAKTVDKHINIWVNGNQVENNMKSIQQAIKHVTNQLRLSTIGSKEYIEASKKLKDLKSIYDEHVKDLKSVSESLDDNKKKQQNLLMAFGGASAIIQTASGAVQKFVGATQEYVEAYAAMDDAMSAVQKTTGMTRDEVEQLNEQLKKVDTRTSQEELLKIAEIGGRMGLAKEDIQAFTEAVNKANVALGDSFQGGAEEISSVLGKISLAYKETREQNIGEALTKIGSALNEVGASANATEGNIAEFVQRVGSMPDSFRPTVQQAIALGAAFQESSIDAEVASRAFGIVMLKASSNVDKFAEVMKRPREEIENLINTNPAQFFVEFSESLNGLSATESGAVLKELKLTADGTNKIIGSMSTNTERFTEILNTSNSAFSEAISLDNEYAIVNNNAAAQLEKAKKKMEEAKVMLGEKLIPIMTKLYETISGSISFAQKHATLIKTITAAIAAYVSVMGAAIIKEKASIALSKTKLALEALQRKSMAALTLVTSSFSLAQAKMSGNTIKAAQAQKALNVAMKANPFGIILTAILAVVAALKQFSSSASAATKLQNVMADASNNASIKFKEEEARVRTLDSVIHDETKSIKERKRAIEELQSIIPAYHASLTEEGQLINDNREAIEHYLAVFELQAKYEAFKDAYTEALKAEMEAEKDRNDIIKKMNSSNFFDFVTGKLESAWDDVREAFTGRSKATDVMDAKRITANLMDEMNDLQRQLIEATSNDKTNTQNTEQRTIEGTTPSTQQPNNRLAEKRDEFRKKITDFYSEINDISASEYIKARNEIEKKIKDYLAEAAELGIKEEVEAGLLASKKLLLERLNGETIQKYFEVAESIIEKIDNSKDDKFSTEFERKISENEEAWEKIFTEANENATNLASLKQDMEEAGATEEEITVIDKAIEKSANYLEKIYSSKTVSTANIIRDFYDEIAEFAMQSQIEQKHAAELAGKSEEERAELEKKWKIEMIEQEYDAKISLLEMEIKAKKELEDEDSESISKMEDTLELLEKLKAGVKDFVNNQDSKAPENKNKGVWGDLIGIDWKNFGDDVIGNISKMCDALEEFKNAAFNVYSSIAEMQANQSEKELNSFTEAQEEKSKILQRQLDDGVISQKYYDAQVTKMDEEREEKEKQAQREQFEREKKASLVEAAISGALSMVKCFELGPIAGAISAAIVAATTATQIAAIASQVNPYARGGFINQKQLALMGEEGREWVASNTLLTDKTTAPIIAALEEYQRGNKKALQLLAPTTPNWKSLSQSAKSISSNFASNNTPVVNNYYSTNSSDSELLNEIKQMNQYLSDPENRRAYISHKLMVEDTENREFIKKQAKI